MRKHRDQSRQQGATSIEFALVLPVALVLIMTITIFALHMTYAALADHAARVALKKAVIRTAAGYPTDAQVRSSTDDLFANNLLGDPTSLTVVRQAVTSRPGPPVQQGDTVKVTVVYNVPAVRTAGQILAFAPKLRTKFLKLGTVTRVADGRAE